MGTLVPVVVSSGDDSKMRLIMLIKIPKQPLPSSPQKTK